MEKEVKTKVVGKYNGHSVKANKSIDLDIVCAYDQLPSYIQTVQYLNNDVEIIAKQPDEKPKKLGTFRVKGVNVCGDGEGKIKFNSMTDFVELENIDSLIGSDYLQLMFKANIEIEEEEEDEHGDEW